MPGRLRHFRRTMLSGGLIATTVATMAVTGIGTGTSSAAPDNTGGTASAVAQSYRINPTAAALSIGVSFGTSLSDYTNQTARAESRAIDLGIIGSTLTSEGCDGSAPTITPDQLPQPLDANSCDPKAAQGYSEQDKTVPAITKSVKADKTPSSQADTTTVPLGDGKVLNIAGAHSQALTHLVNGVREAVATVDIKSVDLAGVVHLGGLHWQATYHTGADKAVTGVFSIGSATIAGPATPTNDPTVALAQINTVIQPLGIQIQPPKSHVDAGILFIDPMALQVVPAPARDSVTGAVLGAAQPVREATYDAILKASCKFSSGITVSDVVVGSITGAGSFSVELGGVQASSAELDSTHFLQDLPAFSAESTSSLSGGSSLSSSAPTGSFSASPTTNSTSGPGSGSAPPSTKPPADAPTTAAAPAAKPGETAQAAPAAAHPGSGKRAGALAGVAAAGLALLLAMAEGDRRMMRRAQRTIPVEA